MTVINNSQIQFLTNEAIINSYNKTIITPQDDVGVAGNNGFTNNSNIVTADNRTDLLNGSGDDNVFITCGTRRPAYSRHYGRFIKRDKLRTSSF